MAEPEQRSSGGILSRRVGGVPVVFIGVVVVGLGYWYFKKKNAATSASTTAANNAQLATTGTSYGDPVLTAYQTGEAAGVSSYSAGVTSGISLVDSILGMFPGSQTASQAGQTAAQTIGTTGTGGTSTGVNVPTPPGGYVQVSNPGAGSVLSQQGKTIYLNVPGMPGTYVPGVVGGQPTPAWQQLANQPGVSEYVYQ